LLTRFSQTLGLATNIDSDDAFFHAQIEQNERLESHIQDSQCLGSLDCFDLGSPRMASQPLMECIYQYAAQLKLAQLTDGGLTLEGYCGGIPFSSRADPHREWKIV
jgi:hypothetical protein